MKIVTIGAGSHAALTHGPALAALARSDRSLELAAVCDIRPEMAAEFARQFGYRRTYGDYREMLDAEQPDGVTLIVPVAATAPIGEAILHRNIPLLMEKPPGRDSREYRQLFRAWERHRTPHLIAFNRRYMPLIQQARALWQTETAAEPIRNIRCDFYRHNRHDADFSTTAIHGIDLVAFLAGAPYCEAKINLQRNARGEAEMISLWGQLANGVGAQLLFCPLTGSSFERLHLTSENFAMTVELPVFGCCDQPGRIVLYQHGQVLSTVAAALAAADAQPFLLGGFYHENRAFVDMLKHRQLQADLANIASVMHVTEAVSRTIATGVAGEWRSDAASSRSDGQQES